MTTSLILHTILALLLLIVPFGALYLLDRPSIRPFGTALVRGIVQLLVFSLIVWGVYKIDNTWINIIWFVAMTIWGGFMVVSKCHLAIKDYLLPASAGLFGGTIAVGLWLLVAVLPIESITARWFIPVMAVLLGHSAAMMVRGLSCFATMFQRNRAQYDFRTSLLAILSPTIANLSALALATLPLLFCGMLIGGFTPINAFAVMLYTIIGCIASSVLSLGISLFLVKSLNCK